ncbi:MAG TPA: FAD binding domain-containing protein [Acidimicrobiales bacterium]
MAAVVAYHRPGALAEALALLDRPGVVVLAGGTSLNPAGSPPVEVVDIQALGLDAITVVTGGHVSIGAAATLQQLADSPLVPDLIRDLARREAPSTLRTLATVGGTVVVADSESVLIAALLVHDAVLTVTSRAVVEEIPLEVLLADPGVLGGKLLTAVTIATGGRSAESHTGRMPADRPIVAAVALSTGDGRTRLALTGVASTPVLVDDPEAVAPPGDFRGSTAYRRHLAVVHARRALEEVR